jgi:transitional endoplasmic reticulum ATPase
MGRVWGLVFPEIAESIEWRLSTLARRIQVANLPPADSGRGVARLPIKLMTELGLSEGDVIEIVGKRSTAARAIRPYGEDEGIDIIRLDGLQRANAGIGSGDFVEVKSDQQAGDQGHFCPRAE